MVAAETTVSFQTDVLRSSIHDSLIYQKENDGIMVETRLKKKVKALIAVRRQ